MPKQACPCLYMKHAMVTYWSNLIVFIFKKKIFSFSRWFFFLFLLSFSCFLYGSKLHWVHFVSLAPFMNTQTLAPKILPLPSKQERETRGASAKAMTRVEDLGEMPPRRDSNQGLVLFRNMASWLSSVPLGN